MKKRLLFVNNNMQIGGVQKSLLNLLYAIQDDYDITLFLFSATGDYLKDIPSGIKVIECKSLFRLWGVSQKECKGRPFRRLLRTLLAGGTKLFGRAFALWWTKLSQRKLKDHYDVAISYLHEGGKNRFYGGCNDFILSKVNADVKIGWLHCDFEQCGANNKHSKKVYRKLDKIVACSEGCRQSFVRCMPEFESKTYVVRNCNDYEWIRAKSQPGIEYDQHYFNVVTVARLSEEKGIDRMLRAIKTAVDSGYAIRYHIIGGGSEEYKLKSLVNELGLDERVVFYGNQENPYPYMVNADLFALTSYHEAAPMVFDEAACLGVPVLATETTSTDEMIRRCGHGIVCENDDESIIKTFIEILERPQRLQVIKENLNATTFDNSRAINAYIKAIEAYNKE